MVLLMEEHQRDQPRSGRPNPTPIPVRRAAREIGEHLSTWRRLQGLTAAQVAERAGVGQTTLRKIESGAGGTSIENVLRVARALGRLGEIVTALDPYESDVGRLRADERLPQRVRHPRRRGPQP